jgi:Spy/CpxP family protein refolding chaperone
MFLFRSKFVTGTVLTLAAALTLCAQPAKRGHGGQRHLRAMAKVLSLTPEQMGQAQSIFQEAGQSAKPLRLQLRDTRAQLQKAIQSGDTNQIQQLSSTQGTEQGQLAAIRATSMSKLYKILTPDQQQKLMAFHQAMKSARRVPGAAN